MTQEEEFICHYLARKKYDAFLDNAMENHLGTPSAEMEQKAQTLFDAEFEKAKDNAKEELAKYKKRRGLE